MEIISRINWVDILVVIICFRTSYVSFHDGLGHQIFPLIGAAATLILSIHYYKTISFLIISAIPQISASLAVFVSFTALLLVFGLIFKLVSSLLGKIVKVTWHPALDKFGGLAFGVIRSAIIACAVLLIIALAPVPYLQRSVKEKSLVGARFLKIGPALYNKASPYLPISQTGINNKK